LNFGETIDISNAGISVSVLTEFQNGITSILSKATLVSVSDEFSRTLLITPNAGTVTYVPQFLNSNYGNVNFAITVWGPPNAGDNFQQTSILTYRVLGSGSPVDFTITTMFDLKCQNPCGILDALCIGCDGARQVDPLRRRSFDDCGVCGGQNDSCLGCDGIFYAPTGRASYDDCGICGGNNFTCSGCDGIPYSGRILNSCGKCDISDSSCGGSFSGTAITGIVLIIFSFIVLLLTGLILYGARLSNTRMELKLQKNPLFKEARQRYQMVTDNS